MPQQLHQEMPPAQDAIASNDVDRPTATRCVVRVKFNLEGLTNLNFAGRALTTSPAAPGASTRTPLLCPALLFGNIVASWAWSWAQENASKIRQLLMDGSGCSIAMIFFFVWMLSSDIMFSVVVDMGRERVVHTADAAQRMSPAGVD